MLWGFSNFSKGMAENDLAYQNKRKNNLALYNNFKQMFPDASAADHEKFIDEIAGDSRYLKNFLPSSDAIGSYVSNRQLEKERETQRFEMQMMQSQLTTNKMMSDELTQIAPSIEDVETKGREKWIGLFAEGSAAQKQAGSWWDNNQAAVRSAVRSGRTDFAKKASADLTEDDLNKGDAHIAQKLAKLYGLEKLSKDQIGIIKDTASERIGNRRRQIELPVYDSIKNDKNIGEFLLSDNPEYVTAGEERIKQIYEQNGLIATQEDITRYKKLHTDNFNLNKGNRIQKAQTDLLTAPQFEPQRDLIESLINSGAEDATILRAIDDAIIDKDYTLFDQRDEMELSNKIMGIMKSRQRKNLEAHYKNITANIASDQVRSEADIVQELKLRQIKEGSDLYNTLLDATKRTLKNKKKKELLGWKTKKISENKGQVLNDIMSINDATRGSRWQELEQEYAINGWAWTDAEKSFWETKALSYYNSNADVMRQQYVDGLEKRAWFLNAAKLAADGDAVQAKADIVANVEKLGLPDHIKELIVEDAGQLVASLSQTLMQADYQTRVSASQTMGAADFDAREKIEQADAKTNGMGVAGKILGISDEELKNNSTAIIVGNYFQTIQARTGVPSETIAEIVMIAYGDDKSAFQKDALSGEIKDVVYKGMRDRKIKMVEFEDRKSAAVSKHVAGATIQPIRQAEILQSITDYRNEITNVARKRLRDMQSDTSARGVALYQASRDAIVANMRNKIGDILRYKDRGNRIIGYFDELRVRNAITALSNAITTELENYRHPAEISGTNMMDGGKAVDTSDFKGVVETRAQIADNIARIDQELSSLSMLSGDQQRISELQQRRFQLQQRLRNASR